MGNYKMKLWLEENGFILNLIQMHTRIRLKVKESQLVSMSGFNFRE